MGQENLFNTQHIANQCRQINEVMEHHCLLISRYSSFSNNGRVTGFQDGFSEGMWIEAIEGRDVGTQMGTNVCNKEGGSMVRRIMVS